MPENTPDGRLKVAMVLLSSGIYDSVEAVKYLYAREVLGKDSSPEIFVPPISCELCIL